MPSQDACIDTILYVMIMFIRESVQKQQGQSLELAKRKFFIPAARMLMSAIYDSRYLNASHLSSSDELVKLLDVNRDVTILPVCKLMIESF